MERRRDRRDWHDWPCIARGVQWQFKRWPASDTLPDNLFGLELSGQSEDDCSIFIAPDDVDRCEWDKVAPTGSVVLLPHGDEMYRLRFNSRASMLGFLHDLEQHKQSNARARGDRDRACAAYLALRYIRDASLGGAPDPRTPQTRPPAQSAAEERYDAWVAGAMLGVCLVGFVVWASSRSNRP